MATLLFQSKQCTIRLTIWSKKSRRRQPEPFRSGPAPLAPGSTRRDAHGRNGAARVSTQAAREPELCRAVLETADVSDECREGGVRGGSPQGKPGSMYPPMSPPWQHGATMPRGGLDREVAESMLDPHIRRHARAKSPPLTRRACRGGYYVMGVGGAVAWRTTCAIVGDPGWTAR
eukprot:2352292-Prymnesium_polylepis.2